MVYGNTSANGKAPYKLPYNAPGSTQNGKAPATIPDVYKKPWSRPTKPGTSGTYTKPNFNVGTNTATQGSGGPTTGSTVTPEASAAAAGLRAKKLNGMSARRNENGKVFKSLAGSKNDMNAMRKAAARKLKMKGVVAKKVTGG